MRRIHRSHKCTLHSPLPTQYPYLTPPPRHLRVVRELVKHDYIVNDEDEDSNTPLHHAALCGYAKTAKALIESHANVEARLRYTLRCN